MNESRNADVPGRRRRLTYANVTATVALVFAMSGGALAAHKYLLNSAKQIKPSLLTSLKGNQGPTGASGTRGATGPTGATGASNPDATTVDGETVTRIFNNAPGPSFTQFYSKDGLTLSAECQSNGESLGLEAQSADANGALYGTGIDQNSPLLGLNHGLTGTNAIPLFATNSGTHYGSMVLTYANSDGATVTVDLGFIAVGGALANADNCAVWGTGISS